MTLSDFNLGFVLGALVVLLFEFIEWFYSWLYSKSAGYDCSNCKAWSCQGQYCNCKRKKKKP